MDYPDCAIDVICEIGARLRQTNLLVTQRASRNVNRVMGSNILSASASPIDFGQGEHGALWDLNARPRFKHP